MSDGPHPLWCDLDECAVYRYPNHPTEVVHRAVLLYEKAPEEPRGFRQVDILEMVTLDPTGKSVAATTGPTVGLIGDATTSTPAAAARIARALQLAADRASGRETAGGRMGGSAGGSIDRRWTVRHRLPITGQDLVRVVATLEADETAGRPAGELLDRWSDASDQIAAVPGPTTGTPAPTGGPPGPPTDRLRVALQAVEVLTTGRALAGRVLAGRWRAALVALRSGADVRAVSRAMALDAHEVAAGLRWWADGQSAGSDATSNERAEVAEMFGGPPVGGGDR